MRATRPSSTRSCVKAIALSSALPMAVARSTACRQALRVYLATSTLTAIMPIPTTPCKGCPRCSKTRDMLPRSSMVHLTTHWVSRDSPTPLDLSSIMAWMSMATRTLMARGQSLMSPTCSISQARPMNMLSSQNHSS